MEDEGIIIVDSTRAVYNTPIIVFNSIVVVNSTFIVNGSIIVNDAIIVEGYTVVDGADVVDSANRIVPNDNEIVVNSTFIVYDAIVLNRCRFDSGSSTRFYTKLKCTGVVNDTGTIVGEGSRKFNDETARVDDGAIIEDCASTI